ncbi:MAG TPA: ribosome recycling factor [Bacteroidia bacterium]|jgi:ribosome recycling factor|nr:ribosome recycling factor [Bacteroidia bacterium]
MNDVKSVMDHAKAAMEKALSHLEVQLQKIRAGKANPAIFENVMVDYYGSMVPISQTASVNTQDSRTIVIQPWEKGLLTPIEKAIQAANMGLNPQNDGILIRITIPPLTEERRKELVKTAKAESEEAKVGIRNARKDAMEFVKQLLKKGLPQDEGKDAETKIQQLTDQYAQKTDKHFEQKEKEILTV